MLDVLELLADSVTLGVDVALSDIDWLDVPLKLFVGSCDDVSDCDANCVTEVLAVLDTLPVTCCDAVNVSDGVLDPEFVLELLGEVDCDKVIN